MNKLVHQQYKDYHFDPMVMDAQGQIILMKEHHASGMYESEVLIDEGSGFNMGSFDGISRSLSVQSNLAPGENVMDDDDYGLTKPTRKTNRLKVIARKQPSHVTGHEPPESSKLTRKIVDMLSDQFDRSGGLGVSVSLDGSSLTGGSLNCEGSLGKFSMVSRQSSMLSEQYLLPTVGVLKVPGEYSATTPKVEVSRPVTSTVRSDMWIHNANNNSSILGYNVLDNGRYLAKSRATTANDKVHQRIGEAHKKAHYTKMKDIDKRKEEARVLEVSATRPVHNISQEVSGSIVSMASNRKRAGSPVVRSYRSQVGLHIDNKTKFLQMSDDLSSHNNSVISPREYTIKVPEVSANEILSTYMEAPPSHHIVENNERVKQNKNKSDRVMHINGQNVRVRAPHTYPDLANPNTVNTIPSAITSATISVNEPSKVVGTAGSNIISSPNSATVSIVTGPLLMDDNI